MGLFKEILPELREALLAARKQEGYVVEVRPNTTAKRLKRVYAAADLRDIGVHGLRHSFASLCYSLEVPLKITMQLGGWSDPTTVMDIYTHLDKKNIAKQTDKIMAFYSCTEMKKEPGDPRQ